MDYGPTAGRNLSLRTAGATHSPNEVKLGTAAPQLCIPQHTRSLHDFAVRQLLRRARVAVKGWSLNRKEPTGRVPPRAIHARASGRRKLQHDDTEQLDGAYSCTFSGAKQTEAKSVSTAARSFHVRCFRHDYATGVGSSRLLSEWAWVPK